jgi:carbon-monoxide dehydrogenase medium subunit
VLDQTGKDFVSARISLGAVAPTPLFAQAASDLLAGQAVSDAILEEAAAAAREIVSPITDMRGTREYRIHVTGVLVKRVLQAAVARARGEEIGYCRGH